MISRRAFFRGLASLGALPLALALPSARGQSAGPRHRYSAADRWEFVKIGPKSRIIGEYEEIGRTASVHTANRLENFVKVLSHG